MINYNYVLYLYQIEKVMTMKKNIYVVGAIIEKDAHIFCAQRSSKNTLPLLWEFPGGKIEVNETPEQALDREIREEMNCAILIHEQFEKTTYEYDFGIVHLTTFLCSLMDKEPEILEHHRVKWLPIQQLATLQWAPADIPAVNKLMLHI